MIAFETVKKYIWGRCRTSRDRRTKVCCCKLNLILSRFLPHGAMQAQPMPSCGVCPSVTFVHFIKTNKNIFKIFAPWCNHTILIFYIKRYGDIPTGTPPPIGALNAGAVGRNRDSEPISGFIACCQCYDQLGVINTVSLNRGKLWQPLVR